MRLTGLLAVVTGLIAGTQQSAPHSVNSELTAKAATVGYATGLQPSVDIDWNWWGKTIKFSKRETRLIAAGSGGAVGAAFKAMAAVVGSGVMQELAGEAASKGYCLKIWQPHVGPPVPGFYNC